MENSIVLKAYVLDGKDKSVAEIRRYTVPESEFTSNTVNLDKLEAALYNLFNDKSSIVKDSLLFWKDEEDEFIRLVTNSDITDTLKLGNGNILKVYLIPKSVMEFAIKDHKEKNKNTRKETAHIGVVCDVCDKDIFGYRFKCLDCTDYDLCEPCFMVNKHPDHIIIRISEPSKDRHLWNLLGFVIRMKNSEKSFSDSTCSTHEKTEPKGESSKQNCSNKSNPNEDNRKNQWEEIFKRYGQSFAQMFDQFGMDALVDQDLMNFCPKFKCSKDTKESGNSKQSECSGAGDTSDKKCDDHPDKSENCKYKICIEKLEKMGFKDENGHLMELVKLSNADISKVLDLLN